MINKFECDFCGNNDNTKAYEYGGALGYEAVVCKVCGAYYDYQRADYNNPDEWSRQYIIAEKRYKDIGGLKFL